MHVWCRNKPLGENKLFGFGLLWLECIRSIHWQLTVLSCLNTFIKSKAKIWLTLLHFSYFLFFLLYWKQPTWQKQNKFVCSIHFEDCYDRTKTAILRCFLCCLNILLLQYWVFDVLNIKQLLLLLWQENLDVILHCILFKFQENQTNVFDNSNWIWQMESGGPIHTGAWWQKGYSGPEGWIGVDLRAGKGKSWVVWAVIMGKSRRLTSEPGQMT